MTAGQISDAAIRFYINQGPSSAVEDDRLRSKCLFLQTKVLKRIWKYAPQEYTIAVSGTSVLTAGVGTLPSDFAFAGKWASVYTSSNPQVPLRWVNPQSWGSLVQLVGQVGTPYYWTLEGASSTTGARQIRTYPLSSDTLTLRGYVKKAPTLVDHPIAPVLSDGGAGTMLAATYTGKVTFVTALGETEGGTASADLVQTINKQIAWTAIQTATGPYAMESAVTSRKLYRPASTGGNWKLVTTIADNVTTTFTDNVADGSLGAAIPTPATAVSGMEQIPDDFHEEVVYEGLVALLMNSQGDGRDVQLDMKFDKAIRRMWNSLKQGQNQVRAFPAFGQQNSDSIPWSQRFLT